MGGAGARARAPPAARSGRLTPGVVLAQPGLCLPDALGMGNKVLEKWTLSGAKVRAAALRRGAGAGAELARLLCLSIRARCQLLRPSCGEAAGYEPRHRARCHRRAGRVLHLLLQLRW